MPKRYLHQNNDKAVKIQKPVIIALLDDGSIREVFLSEKQEAMLGAVIAESPIVSVSSTDLRADIEISIDGVTDASTQDSQPKPDN